MGGIEQAARVVRITTPLAENTLVLSQLDGVERLSTLFDYRLECVSEDPAIDLYELLGLGITVEFDVQEGGTRQIHGVISNAAHTGSRGEYALYSFSVRPWLWMLTRTSDCRIYQEMSVPDILSDVFSENGFDDVDIRLTGSYPAWNFCVQYSETDFSFVSRLMEHEGIYYYFEHQADKHTLVLCDSASAHDTVSHYEKVPHYSVDSHENHEEDHLANWRFERRVQPGKYAINDFAFDQPKRDLLVKKAQTLSDAHPQFEIYDYPGAYSNHDNGMLERSFGEQLVGKRMEGVVSGHETAHAEGNVRGLTAGHFFTLVNCEREDQNREYLIVEARLAITMDSYFSGEGGGSVELQVGLECAFSQQTFRAPRLTPKPLIQGPQTAIVSGPAGEEIWTDQHGRVKLQFHWDRYGASDENSSCWVRVSQLWAGEKWGGIHIPRIGQEVIVEFIDGDPDRPIITGRVYNGDRPVPYDLPANATQSGIKSRSSKGGSPANFNEIRMEDKKGSEEVYIHAEKDQNNIVENDETTSVGHDRTETVGNDETIEIGHDRGETVVNNETIGIGVDRTETVGSNETITIGVNRTESVGANESINIGANRSVTIGQNKLETIALAKTETIGLAKALTIGGSYTVTVAQAVNEAFGASQTVKVAAGHSESVGADQSLDVGKSRTIGVGADQSTKVGANKSITVGKNFVLDAGDSIVLKTGKAKIEMKKDGTITISGEDITIKGKDITINGKGAINAKAKNNIVMKGKKILQN